MPAATKTPQEAFHEVAEVAKGFFAQPDTDTASFAEAFGFEMHNTGGNNMLALKMLDSRHVLGVSDEFTLLYETAEDRDNAVALFGITEDPWLVSGNLEGA